MEYISSDTNVWLDFVEIERLNLPFRLPYVYLMNDETVDDELLSPPGLSGELLQLGLQKTELTEDEFFLAEGVTVMGTIGILDQLHSGKHIEDEEYAECIQKLLEKNGGKVRLPKHELEVRLQKVKKKDTGIKYCDVLG